MINSIIVQNLKCVGCAKTITTKLSALENISDVEVDVESSEISFAHKDDKDAEAVVMKLNALGHPAVSKKNSLAYKAMSYVSCAAGKMRNE